MRITSRAVRLAFGLVAAVGAMCLGAAPARAATVDITEARTAPGADQATLTVTNSLSTALGAVELVVTGASGFSFNFAGANLSSVDSAYLVQPIPGLDILVAIAPAGQTLVAPGQNALLGTFTLPSGSSPLATLLPLDTITGVPSTIFDPLGNPYEASQYVTLTCPGGGDCVTLRVTVVPEPAALALVLGAAALVAVALRREEDSR